MKGANFNHNRRLIMFAGILLLAVLFNGLGWLRLPALASQLLSPVSAPLTRAGQTFGSFLSDLTKVGSFSNRIRQLEEENANLRGDIANLKDLEVQNQQLRLQLDVPTAGKLKAVGAEVISLSPDNVRQRLIINRGSSQGLKVGMPVVWANQLVGKITSVSGSSAQVQLLNDQDFRVLVNDQQTATPGIVKGQVGGAILMERIPHTEPVNTGDIIITSGQDGEFPPGIIIGRVASVESDAASIFKTARIEQLFNQLELRVVMVVMGAE